MQDVKTRAAKPIQVGPKPLPGREELDKTSDALGAHGVVTDGTRAAILARRAGASTRMAGAILGGDQNEIDEAVRKALAKTDDAAKALVPEYADDVARLAKPVLQTGGKTLQAIGKAAPIIGVPFAAYDVYKAADEKDKSKQAGAWTNATFTVAGTVAGIAGLMVAPAVGVPLLVGAAALGGFQLADTFLLDGKAQDAIGEKVGRPLVDGAKRLWDAIT